MYFTRLSFCKYFDVLVAYIIEWHNVKYDIFFYTLAYEKDYEYFTTLQINLYLNMHFFRRKSPT